MSERVCFLSLVIDMYLLWACTCSHPAARPTLTLIIYGADHLEAATFVQRPNRFDLDQKIKINSKKIFRGVESFKSSKNKLCRCRNDGKLTITQLFLTRVLLMKHIYHNYTTIYGSLSAIYGRWPNLSGHVKKTPSILHQSKNPLEE